MRTAHIEDLVDRQVVADRHGATGHDVERTELRVALAVAEFEGIAPHPVGLLGNVEHRDPAIGHFGGRFDALALERCPVQRDVGPHRMVDQLERLSQPRTLTGREGNVDRLAVVVDHVAAPNGPAHLHRLFDARHRLFVRHTVETFDHLGTGRAESTDDAPSRHVVESGEGHRHERRRTGVDVDDGRADLHRLGLGRQVAHHRDGVKAVGLGHPYGVDSGLFELDHLVGGRLRIASVIEHHRKLHGPEH